MTWVRLQHRATGAQILFANTHGPLGNCGSTLGNNWKAGVNGNRQSGDIVFMTGDFNCDSGTQAMKILKESLTNDGNDIDVGIDQILVKHTQKLSGGKHDGSPSDHPLVKGSFQVGGNGPVSNPTTPTNPNGNCQDGQSDCGYWASIGECSRNQAYMSANCKASCGSCSSSSNPTTPTNPTPTNPNRNCQMAKGIVDIGQALVSARETKRTCQRTARPPAVHVLHLQIQQLLQTQLLQTQIEIARWPKGLWILGKHW